MSSFFAGTGAVATGASAPLCSAGCGVSLSGAGEQALSARQVAAARKAICFIFFKNLIVSMLGAPANTMGREQGSLVNPGALSLSQIRGSNAAIPAPGALQAPGADDTMSKPGSGSAAEGPGGTSALQPCDLAGPGAGLLRPGVLMPRCSKGNARRALPLDVGTGFACYTRSIRCGPEPGASWIAARNSLSRPLTRVGCSIVELGPHAPMTWAIAPVSPAISTLSTGFVLGVADGQLITASGEKLGLDKIEAISVSRGLFHQMLRIRTGGEERTVNVTFAREGVADLRRRLQSDPHFRTISVD